MKKLMFVMSFGLILLFGCAKEESMLNVENANKFQVEESTAWVFNLEGNSHDWQPITLNDEQSKATSFAATRSSNSAHTHGDFSAFGGSVAISFSGTQNNGGTHGTAVFQQILNLPFPPFAANVVISMETECVMVDGDAAVYGGLMTEVTGSPFPPGAGPFNAGNYLYFRVLDNGQGNNAQTDQYTQTTIIAPNSRCGILLPTHPAWFSGTLPFPPFTTFSIETVDVENESDKIKVNN